MLLLPLPAGAITVNPAEHTRLEPGGRWMRTAVKKKEDTGDEILTVKKKMYETKIARYFGLQNNLLPGLQE